MDVLQKAESVQLDSMFAHGGLFKTEGVAQKLLAAAIDTPVSVGDLAAEGGAWGIAVLAGFVTAKQPGQSLADFLNTTVFADARLEWGLAALGGVADRTVLELGPMEGSHTYLLEQKGARAITAVEALPYSSV